MSAGGAAAVRGPQWAGLNVLLGAAVVLCVLPASPLSSAAHSLTGFPVQGVLVAAWVVGAVAAAGWLGGVPLAASLVCVGAFSAFATTNSDAHQAWAGALVLPLAIFVGIQALDEGGLRGARSALRLALFAAAALQVVYYVQAVGSQTLSPAFVIRHHTDVGLWESVGERVLANPTNASVIFCTAFAWAVGERAIGNPGRLSWIFVAASGAAVWVTGSRGAYLVAALIIVAAALFHAKSRRRVVMIAAAAVGVIAAGDYWTDTYAADARMGESVAVRLGTRLAAIPVVLSRPFGYGPGTTPDTLAPHLGGVPFIGADTRGATSHDLFLNWGVCVGWFGLGLLLVALLVAFRRTLRETGVLSTLPLVAFVAAGQSAGVDILNPTNAAWATVLWMLVALGWRGAVLADRRSLELRRDGNEPAATVAALAGVEAVPGSATTATACAVATVPASTGSRRR